MNARERFLKTMKFEKPDRVFLMPQWCWGETLRRWRDEGMPEDVHFNQYFGFDRYETVPINLGIIPAFDFQVLDATKEWRIVIDGSGCKKKELHEKPELSMPQWLEFPIKSRQDWENYKKRLNPGTPIRYPQYWEDYKRCVKDRDYPLGISAGSYYGWPRNWMGVDALSYALYDDPMLVHEMCNYIADFVIETIHKAVDEIDIDFALIWEDMSYKAGPLLSPQQFREFMLPPYKRVCEFLHSHGIDIILVDSDGNNDAIIPLWLEAGVTGLYPLEVAADTDAVALRKKYGKDLMLIGNIDKRALAKGREAIEKEVMSKVPWLISQGGYVPFVDHSVPPDVSFQDFCFYVDLIKRIAEDPERYIQ